MKRVFDIAFPLPVCARALLAGPATMVAPAAASSSLRVNVELRATAFASACLPALHGGIPPGTGAGLKLVISFDHLHRNAGAGLRRLDAHGARLGAAFRRKPRAIVAPQARPLGALVRRPGLKIDGAATPAILDEKIGRAPGIERRHVVVDVTAERGADHLGLPQRQIVGLADVVE